MGVLRRLPERRSAPENRSLYMARVIPFAEEKVGKKKVVRITSTPVISNEAEKSPKPRNKNRAQRVFYSIGKFILTIPESTHLKRGSLEEVKERQADRDAIIDSWPAYKVRRWGAATLALGLTTAAVLGYAVNQGEAPDLPIGEPTCEFVHDPANPKVVERGTNESNQALAVIHTDGVNWNNGNKAAEEWIEANNQYLNNWPGEDVVIPQAYTCK